MENSVPSRNFDTLIFEFRGVKVMIDIDLAILYETTTKRLKEQVRRNKLRFPKDFMFELRPAETEQLITLAPRLAKLRHSSVNPLAFTEQGVSMLSSVLNSDKAIKMNIEIMRAFARYRALLLETAELKKEIKLLDGKLTQAFKYLLAKIDALSPVYTDRKKIGYRRSSEEN